MAKDLFYKSDNELSSPFKHPTDAITNKNKNKSNKTKNKINKIKQQWNLSKLIKEQFENEFQQDNTNIKASDYKWINTPPSTIDISLQPWRTNLQSAIDTTLNQFKSDLPNHSIHKFYKLKTNLNKDILRQISVKLSTSQLPQNINIENDLDPEYIFAKRQYLQSMINQTANDIDILKQQLQRQTNELDDAKLFIKTLDNQNNQSIKQNLLNETLHPLMNKIIQNEFGLIKDNPTQDSDDEGNDTIKYNGPMRKNKAKYNLITCKPSQLNNTDDTTDEYEILNQSLPSLTNLNKIIPSINEEIDINLVTMEKTNQLFN